jgi:hypothetical protein
VKIDLVRRMEGEIAAEAQPQPAIPPVGTSN